MASEPVTLFLPESPSLNAMLDMAKERTKRGLPAVYDSHKKAYTLRCLKATREAGIRPPDVPWSRWRLTRAHFQLFNERDPIELLAGLKWPIDFLVHYKFVKNDSARELVSIPYPTQEINRKDRGITLVIEEA